MTEDSRNDGRGPESLAGAYDPAAVEQRWLRRWAETPLRADAGSDRPPYTIVMPPPNVTGDLHLGHAFDNTLIDALIRFRRLQGYEALFQPGTDHAGIATQIVVERELSAEGLTRFDLGREKFLERVWEWKEESGGAILKQLQRLGVGADWSRERFTMDPDLSRAVRHQFVKLYHEGKIFRSERMVNWDPVSQTTLSDLEVRREERQASIWTLAYELGDGNSIDIATVRPETIFADVAIAVHPEDSRYQDLVGRKARIPLTDRWIPVIADEDVEQDFGTGALKITPAHDPTDFDIGERHGLPAPAVLDLHANLSGDLVPGQFRGLDRFEARPLVVEALEAAGALVEVKDHTVSLGLSERTDEPVEPLVSLQWFYDTGEAAGRALAALEAGEMKLHPERYTKVNADWLGKLKPWNISRQLWWGHRIPAWYDADGNIFVPPADDPDLDPTADPRNAGLELTRDPDVFDTWFSSNLWPFSTLGWPDTTAEDFQRFYPTSTLVTGYDILFFWVARMQIAAFELTGRAPFADVLLHGLILDSEGRKMSKSRGNGIDPIEVIDRYGADALRFALCHMSTHGQDIHWDDRRVEMGRNFTNKLWNATRFALMNLEADGAAGGRLPDREVLALPDRWIMSRLTAAVTAVTEHLENYDIGQAARVAYEFVWSEFCDWYLEASKPALRRGSTQTAAVLRHVLEEILRLLHPFMPFITSELWEALGHSGAQLAEDRWPEADGSRTDPEAERSFALLEEAVGAVRNLRAEAGLDPRQAVSVHVSGTAAGVLLDSAGILEVLARAETAAGEPDGPVLTQPLNGAELKLPLSGLVDLAEWKARQERRLKQVEKEVEQAGRKLANEGFLSKAPADVVAEERKRHAENTALLERLRGSLEEVTGS